MGEGERPAGSAAAGRALGAPLLLLLPFVQEGALSQDEAPVAGLAVFRSGEAQLFAGSLDALPSTNTARQMRVVGVWVWLQTAHARNAEDGDDD